MIDGAMRMVASGEIHTRSALLAAAMRTADTDILAVGLTNPRLEQRVDHYDAAAGARILLPNGGAADFFAVETPPAPHRLRPRVHYTLAALTAAYVDAMKAVP